ncbi:MAG: DciA family protein [Methylobacter sp.]
MTKKLTSFKAALSFPNGTIAYYCSQIEQQKQVLQRIHEVLPIAIAEHALHCVVNGRKLLIYTDTAAWASQLRFYNRVILAAIAPVTRESVSIMQIKIRMEPPLTERKQGVGASLPSRKPNIPSAEKIEFIHNHSLTVSDEQLKQALLRLSATLEKLSKRQARA